MKTYSLITLAGEDEDAVFTIIREVGISDVYIIKSPKDSKEAEGLNKKLSSFNVPTKILKVKSYRVEEIFEVVANICEGRRDKVLINAATGDKVGSCLLLSAAFVNGIKAIGVMGNNAMMLPVMKFSYYTLISERKMKILHALYEKEMGMKELSKKLKISLPLISYHIHGNRKNEGLLDMGLVELSEKGNKTSVRISTLGRMLMCGYV